MNIETLSVQQLRRAAQIKSQIEKLQKQLSRILGATPAPAEAAPRKKRRMSAAGKARIIAAQKARWAKHNARK
jgi:hypothetical protein